jgi:hypothetical protein
VEGVSHGPHAPGLFLMQPDLLLAFRRLITPLGPELTVAVVSTCGGHVVPKGSDNSLLLKVFESQIGNAFDLVKTRRLFRGQSMWGTHGRQIYNV